MYCYGNNKKCRVKNAMRGHSRGCNRGEFYYNIKRFLLQPSGRAEAKSLRPLGIQFFFWKRGAGANKVNQRIGRSFPQNQFERRPKTPPLLHRPKNDRFRHLGTNFQTWGENKREGEGRGFHAPPRERYDTTNHASSHS